jgi:hypothetical protein
MTDTKFLFREFMRDVVHICNENNIPFIYQIFIQLGILFFVGLILYIYEECKKKKVNIEKTKLKKIKVRNRNRK